MISSWLIRRGSAKKTTRDGLDYLWRVYLFARKSTGDGLERLLFHIFHMDDPDSPHNHPWWWGRIILWGRYREHYLDGTYKDFGPGNIVWRREAKEAHRLELLSDKVYTLFWHGPRMNVWGFYEPHRSAYRFHPASEEEQDGREIVGTFLPRKIGEAPKG